MNLEKFTDRAKGFIQSAQTVAIRMNHQRITPEHILKALLEDKEGMASQLIQHTNTRLRSCADRLAAETMGDDEDGEAVVERAPPRPNPVTQDEMDAGSIELF